MTQLSAAALSDISDAFSMAGLDGSRDVAGLTEILLLVRSRVRGSSASEELRVQQSSIQHCVSPLVEWLEKESDVSQLTVRQRVDLLWNLYSAAVSRTVLADKFPQVCSNEDIWNETMGPLFHRGGLAEPHRERRHWVIRYFDVLLMLAGLVGFMLDQGLLSGRWRFYLIVGSTLCFGLGALLWYYPLVERNPPMPPKITETYAPLLPRQRLPPVSQPFAESLDVPPAHAPPFPGMASSSSTGVLASAGNAGGAQTLAIGTEIICNGVGPTGPVQGQRGRVIDVKDQLYDVQLANGLALSKLPPNSVTAVPAADSGGMQADAGIGAASGSMTYAPYAAGADEPVKQQATRLREALEKAYAMHSVQPAWAGLFWQAVKNESDLFGLTMAIRGVLTGHGYVGEHTYGPPRYDELKKQLSEMESLSGPPHGVGGAVLRGHSEQLQVADPEQMAWRLKLPADLQRAGPELYRNIRAEGVGSVRQWVNEQHAGLEAKNTPQFQDLFMAATIIDFELAGCKTEVDLMAKLATSDTLEIHLRKLGAFIYYRRTKDKTGANRMLGVRAPGTNADIAPKWMLDDANTHSKTEYQRIERGQKLSKLEHGGGYGGGKSDGKGRKGGRGGGRGKPPKKGGATTQG